MNWKNTVGTGLVLAGSLGAAAGFGNGCVGIGDYDPAVAAEMYCSRGYAAGEVCDKVPEMKNKVHKKIAISVGAGALAVMLAYAGHKLREKNNP